VKRKRNSRRQEPAAGVDLKRAAPPRESGQPDQPLAPPIDGARLDVNERRRAQERLQKINDGLLALGPDFQVNVNRLTSLAGELLNGSCALYNRLEAGMLCAWGQWKTPPGFKAEDDPDGHICYDVIRRAVRDVLFIPHLPATPYVETDPNVRAYELQAYLGHVVRCGDSPVGSLCVVFQQPFTPTDEDFRLLGILAAAVGAEETRRRAEEALRASEERFRGIFEQAAVGVSMVDIGGRFVRSNPAFCTITGYTDDELRGRHVSEVSHPDDFKQEVEGIRSLRSGQATTYACEKRYLRKDGGAVWASLHASVLRDASGQPHGFIGVVQDITEMKRAEEELRRHRDRLEERVAERTARLSESEERYRVLFNSGNDIVIVHAWAEEGAPGKLVEVNGVARERLGYTREEFLGMTSREIESPEGAYDVPAVIRQLAEKGHAVFETVARAKDGRGIPVEVSAHRFNLGGKPLVLSVARDITERKRAEAALRESARRLERAHRQLQEHQAQLVQSEKMAGLGLLAAGVAHEINNPVGFITSNLGTLADYVGIFKRLLREFEALAAATAEADRAAIAARIEALRRDEDLPFLEKDIDNLLRESQDGARRVAEIVQALRSFARPDEGERVEVNLNEGIEATLKLVWNEIRYTCRVTQRLGLIPAVLCHPGQLNQVFLNLILNAAQAIPSQGEITIETAAEQDQVIVRISDTGKGIPPEHIPKLFTPFFTTKPVGKGTGLGLFISYGIVCKHNGTITVNSEVGKGTTFTVRLPAAGSGPA
jgi:PAS domain S-box-containing protein